MSLTKRCTDCETGFVLEEISTIVGKDVQLCVDCLERKMRNGEINSFTEQQFVELSKLLDYIPKHYKVPDKKKSKKTAQKNYDDNLYVLTYGRDLTKLAQEGKLPPVTSRDNEILSALSILSRKFKTNPLLVGEPGVGKTAIVEGIAQLIVNNEVPSNLASKRIIELNMSNVVAGTRYRGEFEQRMKNIIDEAKNNHDIVLFIDEFHTVTGSGGAEGALDASNILKPSLARGDIQTIGATTPDEYRKYIAKDAALERRMVTVDISEPTVEEAVAIINSLLPTFEEHHNATFEEGFVSKAVALSKRYLSEKFLPDKAIDLIDETAAYCKLHNKSFGNNVDKLEDEIKEAMNKKNALIVEGDFPAAKEVLELETKLEEQLKAEVERINVSETSKTFVSIESLLELMEAKTGIPIKSVTSNDKARLLDLNNSLKKHVKGQDEAVDLVATSVKKTILNLNDPKRPNGAFLFLGPTGVGKTELARAVAIEVFGSEDNIIKLDMGEFQEKSSVSKLIGAPPGYIGHQEGGKLTNSLRNKPYSLVLCDEFEKAHPDVQNVLLTVLEDGQLTDNKGKTLDCKNSIFIMTSNAGSHLFSNKKAPVGFGSNSEDTTKTTNKQVLEFIKKDGLFKPEFLNRLDAIAVFNPLTDAAILEIVDKHLNIVVSRIKERGYNLTVSEDVKERIAKTTYNPSYGAREIKRKVESFADLLTDAILVSDSKNFTTALNSDEITIIPV